MKRKLLLLGLFIHVLIAPTNALVTKQKSLITTVEEKIIDYDIGFLSVEEDYPEWNPYSEKEIPLSRKDAIRIAEKEIRNELKLEGEWKVEKISLEKYSFSEFWIYIVTMGKTVDNLEKDKKVNPSLTESYHIMFVEIPVFLNGKVPQKRIYQDES